MGTDEQGRDVMNRIGQGARASLGVGISAVLIALLIGTLFGLISGFVGKTPDLLTMFAMDVLLSFPALLLAIAVVALSGPGLRNSLIAITIVSIPVYARIARSTVLSIKQQEYVNAAHAVGAPSARILFRHVLPNSLSTDHSAGHARDRNRNPGDRRAWLPGSGPTAPLSGVGRHAGRQRQVPDERRVVGAGFPRPCHHAHRIGLQSARRWPARRAGPEVARVMDG